MAWPLAEIAADEKTPILQVPGSVSVTCLMLGFTLLAVTALTKLPEIWAEHAPAHDAQADAEALAHGA
ncbi:TRAP transporter small permease, partial [Azohydromonas lata]|nr:TRAP transporter small permease [Azohydromonas lata]